YEENKLRYSHFRDKSGHTRNFDSLRIVIVQAGGFGTRLALTLAHGSKTLVNVLSELSADPESKKPLFFTTIMDLVIVGAYKFTRYLRKQDKGGIVVLNGDGLLVTRPDIDDGINLIVAPEPVHRILGNLGLVGVDSVDDGHADSKVIRSFIEKPKT